MTISHRLLTLLRRSKNKMSKSSSNRNLFRRLITEPLEERRLLTTIDLASLGSAGITIFGADADDRSGISVSSAGDVNGDGFDDFVIGASWGGASGNPSNRFGESYVIFGA
ncbi:MAG TPA: hypothetical protein DCF63_12820, partial [Planctomycetaceae bacterium]|nr:hypothetical protein [Planctomycetaceae bacterium]